MKSLANIITGIRIIGSIILLFIPVFTAEFTITYLICGFSDMIDGTIARKTNSVSEFGEKFDTISDILFFIISLFKFLPVIQIPQWLWIWIIIVAIIKIVNIIYGYARHKKFIALHTIANKIHPLCCWLVASLP